MKKLVSILVVAGLMMSLGVAGMADNGAIPSKTTSSASVSLGVETATGEKASYTVEIEEDTVPVQKEIEKLFTFVNSGAKNTAPIEYFTTEVQEKVLEQVVAQGAEKNFDMKKLALNEFVTLEQNGFKPGAGEGKVKLSFVTKYQPNQKVVALLGFYTGKMDANGNYIVSWEVAPVEVQEDGSVVVVMSEELLARFGESATVALAMLNETVEQ